MTGPARLLLAGSIVWAIVIATTVGVTMPPERWGGVKPPESRAVFWAYANTGASRTSGPILTEIFGPSTSFNYTPVPSPTPIALALAVPILTATGLYLGVRWVRRGYRRDRLLYRSKPPPLP